jgi:Domain of unknown function (DUF4185)
LNATRLVRCSLAVAVTALGCHEPRGPAAGPTPAVLRCPASPAAPTGFVDLGPLGKPALVSGRDGGAAALVGGKMLWTFQDTLMTAKGADGNTYRTSTAALGDGAGLALVEPLDRAGAPFEFLPYTPEEWAYNQAGGPTERYALWPGSVLPQPDGTALIVYAEFKVHPGYLNYENVGVGLAHVGPGATVATREAEPLFRAPERGYCLAGLADGGFLYLYSVDPVPKQLDSEARVIRAPVGRVAERAAWTTWDGAGWNADLARAVPVLHGPGGDVSVSHNAHAGGLLAVYSGIFSNEVRYRIAARPEGPWSEERLLFTALAPPPPETQSCYAAKEHPALSSDGGRTVVVSYARSLGNLRGELRLASVSLP